MEKPKQNGTEKLERNSYVLSQIHKIAAAAVVELPKESQAVYLEALSEIPHELLDGVVKRVIREWDRPSQMPPLAFIFSRLESNHQLQAEAAWETLQKLIYRDWHPDVGWCRNVQPDPAMDYAIRQVGGLRRIHDVPKDHFGFLRKDFIAAHTRYASEGGAQVQLSHKQATALLDKLQKGLPS